MNALGREGDAQDREIASRGREIASQGREMSSRGGEIDAPSQEIAAGGSGTAAPHYAMGARADEIVARIAATNAGCAEKLGLAGGSRADGNASTGQSPFLTLSP